MSADLTISPAKREQLQQLFVRGNEQMSLKAYEYADNIYFTPCVLQDPENPIYAKTFLVNLRRKFGEKKKTTRSIIAVGKKMTVDSKRPENLFKISISALKSNPWAVEALISAGNACEELGHIKSALVYYQSAVEADSNHIGANFAYAIALGEVTEYDNALACVQRILKQQPDNQDARQLVQKLLAEQTIHRGQYATGTSREFFDFSSTAVPKNEDVMGRVLTLEEQIERRIAKNPQDTANYIELAQCFLKQSNLAEAEKSYTRALEVSDNAPDIVGMLLETQKKRLYAETLRLKEEYERHPQDALKAVFLATRTQYETKSIELAQHRIKHHPHNSGYRYEYGLLLQKNEQVKEAIAEFQTAKSDPARTGDCLLELGRCFQMIRQYKLAMTHYHEAVQTLEKGENKKRALYLAMKLAFTLENYGQAEEYGHQLAAIDFSYRDLGDLLEQITQRSCSTRSSSVE